MTKQEQLSEVAKNGEVIKKYIEELSGQMIELIVENDSLKRQLADVPDKQ